MKGTTTLSLLPGTVLLLWGAALLFWVAVLAWGAVLAFKLAHGDLRAERAARRWLLVWMVACVAGGLLFALTGHRSAAVIAAVMAAVATVATVATLW